MFRVFCGRAARAAALGVVASVLLYPGFAVAATIETGCPVLAIEGDSAFGFSGTNCHVVLASAPPRAGAASASERPVGPFLLPLQFQLEFGWTPLAAGLMVAALFAGNLTIKPFTTPLMRRMGIRTVLLVNALLSVGCFGLLATLHAGMPAALIAVILYLSGALRSIGFTAYNSLAFSDVDGDELTHANTLNAAVQELAAGLGIAVAALLLSQLGSYPLTFAVLGALMALTLVEALRLPGQAGAQVSGSR